MQDHENCIKLKSFLPPIAYRKEGGERCFNLETSTPWYSQGQLFHWKTIILDGEGGTSPHQDQRSGRGMGGEGIGNDPVANCHSILTTQYPLCFNCILNLCNND